MFGRAMLGRTLVVAVALVGCGVADRTASVPPAVSPPTAIASAAVGGPTRYVPINPIRVLDTRTDTSRHRVRAGHAMSIAPLTAPVLASSAVGAAAVQAVVVNLTMVDSGGAGYASSWPTGSAQPTVSSVNTDFAGQTVANMATIPIGADGFVSIYSSVEADFIIDVQGVYESAPTAASGRFVPLTPRRALDTRRTAPLAPASSITVDLGTVGVPADASAAVLNVTATRSRASGYLTVWPADTPQPLASNLNVPSAGYTVANQVLARVTNGRVSVFTFEGTDLIVDVSGYMTGAGAATNADGLFVPIAPGRLLDTRTPGPFSSGQPLASNQAMTLPIAGRVGVPETGVRAVALNVTATRTQAPGYVTSWPATTPMPDTSTLNFVDAGRTVPNHAVTPINGGAAALFVYGGSDLLVDVMGYYTDGTTVAPGSSEPVLSANTIAPPVTTVPPAAPLTSGTYAFLYQQPPKSTSLPYGRWNPCTPIRYAVNIDRATQPMVDQMNSAIAKVEQATGLDLVFVGATSAGLDFEVPGGADVVIGFSDQSATPYLAGAVIGIGGGNFDPGTGRVTSGFAFADVDGIVSPVKLEATFLHEIAHMVGLDHVGDPAQLMYASVTGNSAFGGGDLRGLWYVGAAQGCLLADAPAPRADDVPVAAEPPIDPAPESVRVVAVD